MPTGASAGTAGDTAREALRLLRAECFACHNEEKRKAGLVLTSREAVLRGNEDGVVVVVGRPDQSRLIAALAADADPHMPPKKQLPEAQVQLLRDWIQGGLAWDARVLDEADTEPTPVVLEALPASYRPVMALAVSADGARLAVGRGSEIVIHDLTQTNYPVLARRPEHRDAVRALAWSRDGQRLASGGFRRVVLWETGAFTREREITNGLLGRITALEFSPDGRHLAAADGVPGRPGLLRLFDPTDGRPVASWRAHEDMVFDLEFSRDGQRLVTAGGDKLIKVWEVASRQELARLEGHAAQVLAVAFNTNATQVVSGGADKQLFVWDLATREKIITLGGHAHAVAAVAWPGQGETIFAGTDAGQVLAYTNLRPHSGEQSSSGGDEQKVGAAEDAVLCVATAPDGKTLFAGSQDGAVHGWSRERKLLARLVPEPEPGDPPPGQAAPLPDRAEAAFALPVARQTQPAAPERTPHPSRPVGDGSPPPVRPREVVSLSAEPSELVLSADAPRHGVLITARTRDGFDVDVTAQARFFASLDAPFLLEGAGHLRAVRPGQGTLTARLGRRRVQVHVTVQASARTDSMAPDAFAPPPVSFVRDVLPALSRAGCNAGACHAKADGQNGFKLSVFSYDPKGDYAEIVKEARGRRVFPAAPDESLIIQKPTLALPHEGGQRFERGSETHQLLVRWLREGMAFARTNEPQLQRLRVWPPQRRYHKGARQRLLVQAQYSDGSVRDVTRLAAFASNDKEIADVDDAGVVTVGSLTGQGVIVARYMGLVADSRVLVPADQVLPAEVYAALPRHNFIDELAYAQFQRLGLLPSELCTDAEFLRRASLDTIGVLPTPEAVRAFLAECAGPSVAAEDLPATEPVFTSATASSGNGVSGADGDGPRSRDSQAARRALIDRLLARPEYADYWANKWADLLRPNPDRVGVKSVFVLDQWLRERFRQNQPYDQFVREMLLAEGTNHRDGPAVVYRDRREPADLTTMFSQLFLGTRLECARCHHHPNEQWSQDDFYGFAAFFGSLKQKGAGLSPPISAGTETFYFAPGGTVKHPVTGEVMKPRPLGGPPARIAEGTDPRRALADWLFAPDNPFFARAAVNRVWANFFGRGLVEPADDFRLSNPCVNPPLLDALAEDFVRHGYDLKHLMRTILESRLYQLSTTPNETNLADTRNFSRAYRRRLPAEVLLDAVNDATGVPDNFAGMPPGSRAMQTWSYKIESQFLDAFNRPNPSSDPPCERDKDLSVVQSLHLMNSKALQAKLSHQAGRARRLAESNESPEAIVTELYLATLSRFPTAEELSLACTAFAAPGATRQSATEDVFWALLNSAEFVFNH